MRTARRESFHPRVTDPLMKESIRMVVRLKGRLTSGDSASRQPRQAWRRFLTVWRFLKRVRSATTCRLSRSLETYPLVIVGHAASAVRQGDVHRWKRAPNSTAKTLFCAVRPRRQVEPEASTLSHHPDTLAHGSSAAE